MGNERCEMPVRIPYTENIELTSQLQYSINQKKWQERKQVFQKVPDKMPKKNQRANYRFR